MKAGSALLVYAALPCCSSMWIWSKAIPVLHPLSAASSSSSDVPSGLNASEKNENVTTTDGPPRFLIGMALTFGFTFMFVVDQIGSYFSMPGKLAFLFKLKIRIPLFVQQLGNV